jgi:hypothetical protein
MYFLKGLFARLGFILILAVTVRLIGGLFSPAHPKNEMPMVEVGDRSGGHFLVPTQALAVSGLAAPLDDPGMQTALDIVRARSGGSLGTGDGAKLEYHSSAGPVTLTPSEVAAVNSEYQHLKLLPSDVPDEEN